MAITWQNVGMPSFAGANQAFATGAEMITGGLDRASSVIAPNPEDQLKQQLLKAQIATQESQQLRTKAGMGIDKIRGQRAEYELAKLQQDEADALTMEKAYDDLSGRLTADLDNPNAIVQAVQQGYGKQLSGINQSKLIQMLGSNRDAIYNLEGTEAGLAIANQKAVDQEWGNAEKSELDAQFNQRLQDLEIDPNIAKAVNEPADISTLDYQKALTDTGIDREDVNNVIRMAKKAGVKVNNRIVLDAVYNHLDRGFFGQGLNEGVLNQTMGNYFKDVASIQSGDKADIFRQEQQKLEKGKKMVDTQLASRLKSIEDEGRNYVKGQYSGQPYQWKPITPIAQTKQTEKLRTLFQ